MNWQEIRAELLRLRKQTGLKQAPFERLSGIDRNTIIRVERAGNPKKQVDVETMERWLAVTSKEDVGAFLTRVGKTAHEVTKRPQGASSSVTNPSDTAGHNPNPAEESDAPAVAQNSALLDAIDPADLLEFLAAAFVDAVTALRSGGTLRSGDRGTSSDRREDSGVGGSHPPHVQRVK